MSSEPVAICSRCAEPAEVPHVGRPLCEECRRWWRWPEVLDALDALDHTCAELHHVTNQLRGEHLAAQACSPSLTATPAPDAPPDVDLHVSGEGLEACAAPAALPPTPSTNHNGGPVCVRELVDGDGFGGVEATDGHHCCLCARPLGFVSTDLFAVCHECMERT